MKHLINDIKSLSAANMIFHLSWMVAVYLSSLYSYLLFHTASEFFSIVIGFSLFVIAMNSRDYIKNPYLLFIGIVYFFISLLDLLHTLSYKGMNIFTDYAFYANQLWIAARYLESFSLLAAFMFLKRSMLPNVRNTLLLYSLLTAGIIASIFWWKFFPVCFIEGVGQTDFKKISEYIIIAVLILNIYLLSKNRQRFTSKIYTYLAWSLTFTILSELAFTFYISNYGFSNLVGHYFKLFSYILIYLAIIRTGIRDPFNLIFRELDLEIKSRKAAEEEKEGLIRELKGALSEIKNLQGIIPVCMHCKKVRDDSGYWNLLEEYIKDHSDAEISHGLCPDCLREHYPNVDADLIIEKAAKKTKIKN